ncbi:hypothetical protein [Chromobacterium sphagni]|uniref:Antibiotic biosynthesis monooxygenase n=1 Tax=Chromobacterium sphagni TaxID=1903179 RepID=A0A1S1X5K4_9NEIS|nr:hypothetical protein [Chromobacterium sphagni]OHX14764.1 hypothetical protein BI347_15575 [Chromobacterium sphagni]OHX16485.1 hypothetical protein BI344_21370 [Chromobacterium sphagni]
MAITIDAPPALACWAVSLVAGEPAQPELARCVLRLAAVQPGYLGGEGQVTYWDTVEAIAAWRARVEQLSQQRLGREAWRQPFSFVVSRVAPQAAIA